MSPYTSMLYSRSAMYNSVLYKQWQTVSVVSSASHIFGVKALHSPWPFEMIIYYNKHGVSNANIRLWKDHSQRPFLCGQAALLSSPACCDNAHRGRADVRCQQHICIQPQSPPLHWPDNGTALLLLLHWSPPQKKKKKKRRGRVESCFMRTNAHSACQNYEIAGLKSFFQNVQGLMWMPDWVTN